MSLSLNDVESWAEREKDKQTMNEWMSKQMRKRTGQGISDWPDYNLIANLDMTIFELNNV